MKALVALILLASLLLTLPAAAQTEQAPVNYCASTLSYDLPEGWVAGDMTRSQSGVYLRLANSEAGLAEGMIDSGEVVMIVNVYPREAITQVLSLDADTPIVTLMQGIGGQAVTDFTPNMIEPLNVQDRAVARFTVQVEAVKMTLYALDLEGGAIVVLSLSTPTEESDQWQATAQAFLESLRFDAPPFPAESVEYGLNRVYATEDCSVAFAFPEGWYVTVPTLVRGAGFSAGINNYNKPIFDARLHEGQAFALIAIAPANDDLLEDVGMLHGAALDYVEVSRETTTINGSPALLVDLQAEEHASLKGDALGILVARPDAFITMTFFAASGELEPWRETALAIVASVQVDAAAFAEATASELS